MPTFSVLHEDSLTFGPAQRAGPPFCAHWGLNPGPSACRTDVIPLHHVPSRSCRICEEASSDRSAEPPRPHATHVPKPRKPQTARLAAQHAAH